MTVKRVENKETREKGSGSMSDNGNVKDETRAGRPSAAGYSYYGTVE